MITAFCISSCSMQVRTPKNEYFSNELMLTQVYKFNINQSSPHLKELGMRERYAGCWKHSVLTVQAMLHTPYDKRIFLHNFDTPTVTINTQVLNTCNLFVLYTNECVNKLKYVKNCVLNIRRNYEGNSKLLTQVATSL